MRHYLATALLASGLLASSTFNAWAGSGTLCWTDSRGREVCEKVARI